MSRFVGFTPTQRAWIIEIVARAPRPARDAVTRVAPYVTFRRGTTDELSEGDHITTYVGTSSVRFLISLGPRTRATRDALAAHMLMHELGHAVDNGLVGDALRASFGVLFSRSPAWMGCFMQPLGSSRRCVPGTEISAEQFGFYGARDRRPRTTYGIPPLYRLRGVRRAAGACDRRARHAPRARHRAVAEHLHAASAITSRARHLDGQAPSEPKPSTHGDMA